MVLQLISVLFHTDHDYIYSATVLINTMLTHYFNLI